MQSTDMGHLKRGPKLGPGLGWFLGVEPLKYFANFTREFHGAERGSQTKSNWPQIISGVKAPHAVWLHPNCAT